MAYSNVGIPVFYVDNYLYHKTIGTSITEGFPSDVYTLNPAVATEMPAPYDITLPISPVNYSFSGNMKYYIALLNHNIGSSSVPNLSILNNDPNGEDLTNDFTEVLNGNISGNVFTPLDGSTILKTSVAHDTQVLHIGSIDHFIGAISTGIQYTMPHSPDLSLSMEIEMDGVNTITASGGGSISNVKYTGNPLWVNGNNKTNPFDVYNEGLDVTQMGARRNGRKSWRLKFSYVSDTDLFSSNPKASSFTEHPNDSTYETSDLDGLNNAGNPTSNSYLGFNIETDDSFYAQVWNKTLGGALPFIFQPDSTYNDDFYICRFDQKSLKVSQVAYKVYDISLRIVESW